MLSHQGGHVWKFQNWTRGLRGMGEHKLWGTQVLSGDFVPWIRATKTFAVQVFLLSGHIFKIFTMRLEVKEIDGVDTNPIR